MYIQKLQTLRKCKLMIPSAMTKLTTPMFTVNDSFPAVSICTAVRQPLLINLSYLKIFRINKPFK